MNTIYSLHHCDTNEDLAEAGKLRYLAYRNVEAIATNSTGQFRDPYDELPNSKTCLIREEGKAVAAVRACVYSPKRNFLSLPGLEVFDKELENAVGLDKVIVESNRLVIDPDKMDSKILFKFPFRFIILNLLKFDADYIITAVRPRHIPLYRRMLCMEAISGPKTYPGLNVEMVMMAGNCRADLATVISRDEIFNIAQDEIDDYNFGQQVSAAAGKVTF